MEPERRDAPVLSMKSVDSFLPFLERNGRTTQTLDTYRRCLEHLYAFLPDDKEIEADTLRQWREAMRAEGRTIGSMNIHISAANSWLDF